MRSAQFVQVELLASDADVIAARGESRNERCEEERERCGVRCKRSHVGD